MALDFTEEGAYYYIARHRCQRYAAQRAKGIYARRSLILYGDPHQGGRPNFNFISTVNCCTVHHHDYGKQRVLTNLQRIACELNGAKQTKYQRSRNAVQLSQTANRGRKKTTCLFGAPDYAGRLAVVFKYPLTWTVPSGSTVLLPTKSG